MRGVDDQAHKKLRRRPRSAATAQAAQSVAPSARIRAAPTGRCWACKHRSPRSTPKSACRAQDGAHDETERRGGKSDHTQRRPQAHADLKTLSGVSIHTNVLFFFATKGNHHRRRPRPTLGPSMTHHSTAGRREEVHQAGAHASVPAAAAVAATRPRDDARRACCHIIAARPTTTASAQTSATRGAWGAAAPRPTKPAATQKGSACRTRVTR